MSVGNQATEASVNQSLSDAALQLRNLCQAIMNFQSWIVQEGTAGLEAMGFSAADAAAVLTMSSYMNTVAGCYFGTVQQGGSGGTGAIMFNFNNALCGLWAGQ